jgi:hypothetical protein
MNRRSWEKIEAAAMEKDCGPVMSAVAKTTGHALYFLDLGIYPFRQCIGDTMSGICHNIIKMTLPLCQGRCRFLITGFV